MSMFLIAVLTAILEVTAVPYASAGASTFDLEVIVLVFYSLKRGLRCGAALGIFFGVFTGIFGTGAFWLNVFLYTATGFFIGYIGQWFYKESLWTFIFMVLCATTFVNFSHYAAKLIYLQMQVSVMDYAFRLFSPAAFYTMGVSIFLFYFLKGLRRGDEG